MRHTFSFAFILLQVLLFVNASGFYSIVAPGTVQSHHGYSVSVTLHGNSEPATIKVGITGPSYNEVKTIDVTSSNTKVVHFDLPKLKDGQYQLLSEGIKGLIFKNSTNLNYKNKEPKIYIQTDKAIYKPGDLVQYRIMALDENTRPAKHLDSLGVVIKDGARNLIKQINDIKLLKGVYSGEFHLSEQPVLGDWLLEVSLGKHDDATKTEKKFEVAKYVLPKFSVDLETANDISYEEGAIKITVRSKYTYGKPVNGEATITIDANHGHAKSEKTIEVDGKGYVEFDMVKDLKLNTLIVNEDFDFSNPLSINILAVMTENITGNKQNKTISVNLHQSRFNIEVPQNDYNIEANKAFEIEAFVKKLDGSPVQDAKEFAELHIAQDPDVVFDEVSSNTEELVFTSELDINGMAVFTVTIPEDGDYNNVRVKYASKTHFLAGFNVAKPDKIKNYENDVGPLKLVKKTENPKLGHDVTIAVKSIKNIPYYVYAVVARGNIVKHQHVKVPENTKSHEFSFKTTFEMIPVTDLYVYFVLDGNLIYQEMSINFPREFENKIAIAAPSQAEPSKEVTLLIKSDPDSFVGLLGVDQSVLLLQSGNDFDSKTIYNDLSQYETTTPEMNVRAIYPGIISGLVTLTNANYPYSKDGLNKQMEGENEDNNDSNSNEDVVLLERKNFLETWIWSNFSTDSTGLVTLTKKIPDTITSWVITGFSLNEKTGFGMVENPTNIQVFLPFFVSTNLPYSVKRGEVITIPIYVFNYMDEALDAEITMVNTDLEYEFTDVSNEGEDLALEVSYRVKTVTVPSNSVKNVPFEIRPNKVGEITLEIHAITPLAGDAIHQKIKVESEGITHFDNQAILISPSATKQNKKESLKATIPVEAVSDSEFVELSVVGDILGPTIKHFDNLVSLPTGCGEQTMFRFVPNILVLHYLDAIKMDMPLVVEKAKKYMEVGYQKTLTYKHHNGAFTTFGERSCEANSWLTAYVARSFIQARKYITIDATIIEQALAYLVSNQLESGQFKYTGRLYYPTHQNAVGFTAFALLAFLEDVEYSTKYKTQIDKGIKYLVNHIDNEQETYALSIAALVLHKIQHAQASKLLQKLENRAKQANGLKWWTKSSNDHSNDVEITAYVLQSYIYTEQDEKLLPIIRWLVANRNSKGGYDSTQNTVVALQALIKFDEKYVAGRNGKMTIKFEAQDSEGKETTRGSFSVDKNNLMTLQTHVLPKSSRQITLEADGLGSSLVQLSYRYNLATNKGNSSIEIKHTIKPSANPNQLLLNVCTIYVPPADDVVKESNMVLMEIYLPSGYIADTDIFNDIRSVKEIQRIETKNSDTAIVIYFDSLLAGQQLCVDAAAEKIHAVTKQKPAAITIYDYYKPEQRATVYYQVKSS